jgi:hypothetical protein
MSNSNTRKNTSARKNNSNLRFTNLRNNNLNLVSNTLMKTLSAEKNTPEDKTLSAISTPKTNEHHYDVPMIDLKNWYEKEMEAVGHLAAMKDVYLRRMYASKTASGMKHLARAIQEKIDDSHYTNQKKHELALMKDHVTMAMEHVKADYDVTEDNLTYKWNVKGGKRATRKSRKMIRRRRE